MDARLSGRCSDTTLIEDRLCFPGDSLQAMRLALVLIDSHYRVEIALTSFAKDGPALSRTLLRQKHVLVLLASAHNCFHHVAAGDRIRRYPFHSSVA